MRARRHRPRYPVLAAALAVGALASSCGTGDESVIGGQTQPIQQADAGTRSQQPLPPDFIGGDIAYEELADGGVR